MHTKNMGKRKVSQQLHASWLQEHLATLSNPSARALVELVDTSNVIGLNDLPETGKIVTTTVLVASEFPEHVVLVKVGDFYEAMGVSAIALIEFCSLRPMGATLSMKAGSPTNTIQRVLDLLLAANLKVVMVEEEKVGGMVVDRFVSQLVSKANPVYFYCQEESDELRVIEPIVVIMESALAIINLQAAQYELRESLDRAVMKTIIELLQPFEVWGLFGNPLPKHVHGIAAAVHYVGQLHRVSQLTLMHGASSRFSLCRSTTSQLGISTTDHIPSVVQTMVGRAPGFVKDCLYKLLVSNLDSVAGQRIRQVVQAVHSGAVLVREGDARLTTSKLVGIIKAKQLHTNPQILPFLQRISLNSAPLMEQAIHHSVSKDQLIAFVTDLRKELIRLEPPSKAITVFEEFFARQETYQLRLTPQRAAKLLQLKQALLQTSTFHNEVHCITENDVVIFSTSKPGPHCIPATNGKGKARKGMWTTILRCAALEEYHQFITQIKEEDRTALSELCSSVLLRPDFLTGLVALVEYYILLKTVHTVLLTVTPLGWHQGVEGPTIQATQLFPYWLSRYQSIPNDVTVAHDVTLLTAPNGSGKTTLLRTLLLSCILNNIGLPVPAAAFSSPHYEYFFLRLPGADRPLLGLSSFGAELVDLNVLFHMERTLLNHSLICLDEIGRGTCAKEAVAFASSVVQFLYGATVIFSTHIHELLDLLPAKPKLSVYEYKVQPNATCRSSESLKLCQKLGLPPPLLMLFQELLQTDNQLTVDVPDTPFNTVLKIGAQLFHTEAIVIEEPFLLPPSLLHHPASLYIIEEHSGLLYIGETKNALRRKEEHRQRHQRSGKTAIYPCTDRTQSLLRETLLQKNALANGIQLSSTADAFHLI